MLYRIHLAWSVFKLEISVVMGTDCTYSCNSIYHTITTTETGQLVPFPTRTPFLPNSYPIFTNSYLCTISTRSLCIMTNSYLSYVLRPTRTLFILHVNVSYLFYIVWPTFFSSPDPKGHVSYCHHLASVVRSKTFQSSKEPLKQMGPNVAGMFICMV